MTPLFSYSEWQGMAYSFILLVLSLIYSSKTFCLVEYSPKSEFRPRKAGTIQKKKENVQQTFRWELGLGYEEHKVTSGQNEGQASFYTLAGRPQTGFDISLYVDYWSGHLEAPLSSTIKGSPRYLQKGNLTVKAAFNWLYLGAFPRETIVNLYGGAMFPSRDSTLASTRLDKIFNFETTKRFNDFLFGLDYELRLTGRPSENTEVGIGDVHTIGGRLAWMATADIRFVIEGAHVEIKASEDGPMVLGKEHSFGYVSPQLHLLLSPTVHLKMGARFRTQRIQNDAYLLRAKIWDLKAGYSNSLWVNLWISI